MINQIFWLLSLPVVIFMSYKLVSIVQGYFEKKIQ